MEPSATAALSCDADDSDPEPARAIPDSFLTYSPSVPHQLSATMVQCISVHWTTTSMPSIDGIKQALGTAQK